MPAGTMAHPLRAPLAMAALHFSWASEPQRVAVRIAPMGGYGSTLPACAWASLPALLLQRVWF